MNIINKPHLYKIGITGGICSGKSTLIKYLGTIPQAKILNLDNFTPVIYQNNLLLVNKLKNRFGSEIINETGGINKKLLGKIVFKPENKHHLEYLNYLMRPEFQKLLSIYLNQFENEFKNNKFVLFIEGAIIIEAKFNTYFDELWVVKASQEELKRRFKKRIIDENIKEYDESMLEDIQKSQMSLEEKVKLADKVIDTSGTKEETQAYVRKLLNELGI